MKALSVVLLVISCALAPVTGQNDPPESHSTENVVFRQPFTLRLRLDKKHYYVEEFGKIPYVQEGNVYLFCGETFGLSLDILDDSIRSVRYQPEMKLADVVVKFSRQGPSMTMLVIENHSRHTLFMDALMTVPDKKGVYKTSLLPVLAGKSNYESWPHPIVQLVLRNLRLRK